MNSNNADDMETTVTYKVSHLLEYYDKAVLLRFFQGCDEYECSISEAFISVAAALDRFVAENGCVPEFADLAEEYAATKSWSFRSYAGTNTHHSGTRQV